MAARDNEMLKMLVAAVFAVSGWYIEHECECECECVCARVDM